MFLCARNARRRPVAPLGTALAVWLVGISIAGIADAQSSSNIVRVEEDWELVVGQPDQATCAPQVTCTFSPLGNVDTLYASFELNHRGMPNFTAGGMQLQVWDGETALAYGNGPSGDVMMDDGETVTWTQSMTLTNGTLTFQVVNGQSTTWGTFGATGYLKQSVPSPVADLSGYDSSVSVANSVIGFASNRVTSLVLKQVRLYDESGQVVETISSQSVYP